MKKIIFLIIPLIVFGFWIDEAKAGVSDNISGYAWSENIGWISFNNTSGGGATSYGVNINPTTGNFSGYAWSENIGWINFAPAGPYPASPNYYSCLELPGAGQACDGIGNYNVGGWARALAFGDGWDGWIKLRGTNYGVSIDNGTGDFSGYAWSDAVVGWIKFQGVNYKVGTSLFSNQPPNPPGTGGGGGGDGITWDNCSFQGKSVPIFNWTYSDPDDVPIGTDPQTAYEIQVAENASFNGQIFNHLVNNTAATSYALDLYQDDENPDDLPLSMRDYELNWDREYHWRVRVKDSYGNWSDFSNPRNFRTPDHVYPYPGFSWDPPEPTQKEVVVFTPDQSGLEYAWTVNALTGTGYEFVDGTDILDEQPHIKFLTFNNTVELKVTDTDGYSCESPEPIAITAELPLPEYKEVPPIIWLKKALVAFASLIDGLYIFGKF